MNLIGLFKDARWLLRSPRETAAAGLMLAVGVACLSAAYAIVRGALLQPLPYREPHRLVSVWDVNGPGGYEVLSTPDAAALADVASFARVARYAALAQRVNSGPDARTIRGLRVSGTFFEVLGIRAARGRTLTAGDTRLAEMLPIVISRRLSRAEALDPGDLLKLDGLSHRVVGVMPPTFFFPDRDVDYWVPIVDVPPALRGAASSTEHVRALARLAPGVDVVAAESGSNAALSGAQRRPGIRVRSLDDAIRGSIRAPLLVVQIGAGLVLLLTCMNSAWLLRARVRRLDYACAVMAACGASPRRLTAMLVAEAACLGAVVVPFALLVASGLLALSARVENGGLWRIAAAEVTGPVLAFTAGVAMLAAFLALLPAIPLVKRAAGGDGLLRGVARERPRLPYAVAAMAVQAAIVFAVALQAFLLLLVLNRMVRNNVGFESATLAGAEIRLSPGDASSTAARLVAIVDGLRASGVRSAVTNVLPLAGAEQLTSARTPDRSTRDQDMVRLRPVSSSYFSLCGVQLVEGRALLPADAGQGAIVVDEAFAARVLGPRMRPSTPVLLGGAAWEVVGVAKSVRHSSLFEAPEPTAYLLYDDVRRLAPQTAAMIGRQAVFIVDEHDGTMTSARLRAILAAELPGATMGRTWRLRDLVWAASGERPLMTLGVALFAAVTILLLGAGLHGMMSYETARRRREIGVRLALGATPRRIAFEVLTPVLATCLAAGAGGSLLALAFQAALTRAAFVPEPALGPAPWAAPLLSAAAMLVVVAAAVSVPVIRAARIDSVGTLRLDA